MFREAIDIFMKFIANYTPVVNGRHSYQNRMILSKSDKISLCRDLFGATWKSYLIF